MEYNDLGCDGCCETCRLNGNSTVKRSIIVAVVGMPHCGRTMLLSRFREQYEYDATTDTLSVNGCSIRFVDVLNSSANNSAQTVAQKVASFVRVHKPDMVLNVVDSTDLEESLQLTARLIDMHMHLVVALNRYDELAATAHSVDYRQLGKMMGFSAIPTDAQTGRGISDLLEMIVDAVVLNAGVKHTHVPYGQDLETAISEIENIICQKNDFCDFDQRFLAIQLLENDEAVRPLLGKHADDFAAVAREEAAVLQKSFGKHPSQLIEQARKGFVHGALTETLIHGGDDSDHTFLQRLDAVLTNKWLGLPILIIVLLLVFEATFWIGSYPQGWIDRGVGVLAEWLHGILRDGWLNSMLIDGVVQGVGAVISFLPNIVILFFFLSLLEDSGYMSRAAFVMDKLMHRIGLHGRSFIPMLIGFGCNVPAIMAARSIENAKDRTLTMLMIPFMSCSARLPVYMLFVSAFFAQYKAVVMISIYILGILFSIAFAFLMKHTKYFRQEQEDYVSELPPFRKPTMRNTGMHIWERTADYLKKISTVILAASVIIWALEYFPAERTQNGKNKEESYLADVGHFMEPIMRPLGFDWKMNVCILTGLPAKEAIVSTMGILYHVHDGDSESLTEMMRSDTYMMGPRLGQPVFTPVVSWSFMIFVLLYFPCVATISTLRREIGRGWAAFTVVHSLLLAWLSAFVVYQVGTILFL